MHFSRRPVSRIFKYPIHTPAHQPVHQLATISDGWMSEAEKLLTRYQLLCGLSPESLTNWQHSLPQLPTSKDTFLPMHLPLFSTSLHSLWEYSPGGWLGSKYFLTGFQVPCSEHLCRICASQIRGGATLSPDLLHHKVELLTGTYYYYYYFQKRRFKGRFFFFIRYSATTDLLYRR